LQFSNIFAIMKRPTQQLQLRRKGVGNTSGGLCSATILLKVVWVVASALFLLCVSLSMNLGVSSPLDNNNEGLSAIQNDLQKHNQQSNNDESLSPQRRQQIGNMQQVPIENDMIQQSQQQPDAVINIQEVDDVQKVPIEKDIQKHQRQQPDTVIKSSRNNNTTALSDEEVLLQWLRKHSSNSESSASSSISQLLSSSIHFPSGSLPISQLSTLQQCYTDATIYKEHFKEKQSRRIPYSEKHKLAYILLPKSGSSTGRFMMQHEFESTERRVTIDPALENVIAFVREPLSRFYSQYDEAFVRTSPWNKMQNPFYDTNKDKHPFPYLFDGMTKYHDYEDAFCPPEKRKSRKDCIYAPSQENGTLASRLDRFVQDYDGRSPFDVHLALQVPMLSNIVDGRSLFITELHNTTNSEGDWNNIAKKYIGEEAILENAEKNKKKGVSASGGVIQGRSYPRRFNKTKVGIETEKRICQLTLLDYCCLNFPLPAVCNGGEEESKALNCMMDYDAVNDRIRIQPSVFPDKAK